MGDHKQVLVLTPALFGRDWSPVLREQRQLWCLAAQVSLLKGQLYLGKAAAWPLSLTRVALQGSKGCSLSPVNSVGEFITAGVHKSRDISRATFLPNLFSWLTSKVHAHRPSPRKSNQALKCAGHSSMGKPSASELTNGLCPSHQPPCCFLRDGSTCSVSGQAHSQQHSTLPFHTAPASQLEVAGGKDRPLGKAQCPSDSTTQAPLKQKKKNHFSL